MKTEKLILALRDPEFRNELNEPIDHPAGLQELEDEMLSSVTGGCTSSCGGGNNRSILLSCPSAPYCA